MHTRFVSVWLLASILLFATACKKPETPVRPTPEPQPVTQYTQYGTPFGQMPELSNVIMYEVNLRAYSQSGDLQGVMNRLDEIKSFGVNVIWLMPIFPIGEVNSVNSPYAVRDYKAVGEEYGSLEDLRALTDAAHEKGMAVILDWVANHTAWDHPWISNSSYYTQDASGNIIHPEGTNWQDVADLNFSNGQMRLEMIDALEYWVYEANIDGYRCDAADFVPKDFWQQAIDSLRNIEGRDLLMLAEGASMDHLDAGFDLNFSWSWYGELKGVFEGNAASRLYTTHNSQYGQIPQEKHELRFITNHDESAWDATPVRLFEGKEGSLAAMAVTTFMGGVPLIYGGQEVAPVGTISFFNNEPIDWTANPGYYAEMQQLMNAYADLDAARWGDLRHYNDQDVSSFLRIWEEDSLLILANVRDRGVGYKVPAEIQGDWADVFSGESVTLDSLFTLAPHKYFLLEK